MTAIGLDEDESAGGPDDDSERPGELAKRLRRGAAREDCRYPERERELREL
jgi:hypothetical protein